MVETALESPRGELPLEVFVERAEAWLDDHAERIRVTAQPEWGAGSDSVAIFRNLTADEERAHVETVRAWQRLKSDAGYGSISWPVEYGGRGLPWPYEEGFRALERKFATPPGHEALSISLNIEAPTILAIGNDDQKRRYIPSLRRADEICCQLFSEPAAGSDLGAIATRAVRDRNQWVIEGQKVWTSGAQFADVGYLIARTDTSVPRQHALTAFLVPMQTDGIEIRPLRQMTGGSSFNEVFFTECRVSDEARLGPVGGGWAAAMTTLGFERSAASSSYSGGPTALERLVLVAKHLRVADDPRVRQGLVQVYIDDRVKNLTTRRARDRVKAGGVPGPEGSLGKLAYTNGLTRIVAVASSILGPRLAADTGEWGTFAWSELVNGAPGMRVAGGTDEIQRNTIAERVLGLPRGPR